MVTPWKYSRVPYGQNSRKPGFDGNLLINHTHIALYNLKLSLRTLSLASPGALRNFYLTRVTFGVISVPPLLKIQNFFYWDVR